MDKFHIGKIEIEKPAFLLSPMEEVSDRAFRMLCKENGADITISEFAASDALIRDVEMTKKKLQFDERERPFGIQIFGNQETVMVEAAQIAASYQPDFIDINWGCPVKKIVGKGGGSGMLQNPNLLVKITAAIVKAVPLPVTVKTRLGWDDNNKIIVNLAQKLQDAGIAALSIHGRTRAQMYRGSADWTLIGAVKQNPLIHIPIFGNGDIVSAQSAKLAIDNHHVDGVMIGRGSIGNPWVFAQAKSLVFHGKELPLPTIKERLDMCKRHLQLALQYKEEHYAIINMQKHYKTYFKDIDHFKEYRIKLMTTTRLDEIYHLFDEIEEKFCTTKTEKDAN